MYNYALCICHFCMIIESHRKKSNTSRFYSKISVYFVTVLIKRLVWHAASSASGSLVQKVGGHARPAPKLEGASCPPPGPTGCRVPAQLAPGGPVVSKRAPWSPDGHIDLHRYPIGS